ncbi:unnamed protein product [Lampetra fluviatilis]
MTAARSLPSADTKETQRRAQLQRHDQCSGSCAGGSRASAECSSTGTGCSLFSRSGRWLAARAEMAGAIDRV